MPAPPEGFYGRTRRNTRNQRNTHCAAQAAAQVVSVAVGQTRDIGVELCHVGPGFIGRHRAMDWLG